ncbi:MAG: type II toxin-antitoxin system prevent-host-death family antitoxin [Alphaproteobacteria bacterium]|nr:type II toxin-antitoxin system prevent-host-death family antitoxin [Alphaproteobacteria bacterium]
MKTIPASEFQRNFGTYKEIAQREPVAVTSNGRNSVVLVSAADYEQFAAYQKQKAQVSEDFEEKLQASMERNDFILKGLAK